jgi:hypothetical protein
LPEDLLRKYRPVGPPPRLRARVVEGDAPAWPWAAAAAALLLVALSFHLATSSLGLAESMQEPFGVEARIAYIAERLGGSEAARETATWIVMEEEVRRALPAVSSAAGTVEGVR